MQQSRTQLVSMLLSVVRKLDGHHAPTSKVAPSHGGNPVLLATQALTTSVDTTSPKRLRFSSAYIEAVIDRQRASAHHLDQKAPQSMRRLRLSACFCFPRYKRGPFAFSFPRTVAQVGIPVTLCDERLTSVEARGILKDGGLGKTCDCLDSTQHHRVVVQSPLSRKSLPVPRHLVCEGGTA